MERKKSNRTTATILVFILAKFQHISLRNTNYILQRKEEVNMKNLMEMMKDWNLVKDRLILSVCNANKKGLDGIVHTNIEDLVLVPKVLVSLEPDFAAAAIPKDFCTTYYDVTEDDLILQAKQNAPKNLPLVLKPLESMLID